MRIRTRKREKPQMDVRTETIGFERAGVASVVGVTDPENLASIQIFERCHMRYWKDVVRKGRTRAAYRVELNFFSRKARNGWKLVYLPN